MRFNLSIMGLYKYDPTIFDRFHVPEHMVGENIEPYYDKEIYISRILFEGMDLELVYPDAEYMKNAIQLWSLGKRNVWNKIAEALTKYYNPIENYNRSETWTDTDTRTENWTDTEKRTEEWTHGASIDDTGTVDVKRTDNLKQKTDGTTSTETTGDESGNQTETNAAIGYNSDEWKDNTKTTTDHESDTSSTSDTTVDQTVENTGTQDSLTTNDLNRNLEENSLSSVDGSNGRVGSSGGSVTHSGNVSGNIGVTTSQQMVTQEIELRKQNQLVDIVVRDFIETFCILVY